MRKEKRGSVGIRVFRPGAAAIILAHFAVLFFCSVLSAQEKEVITLVVGESKLLQYPNVTKVAIANPSIADVRGIGTDQVWVVARRAGVTNMILWFPRGVKMEFIIQVLAEDPKIILYDLQYLLLGLEGVRPKIVSNRVVLEGEVHSEKDYERIQKVTELYPQVISFIQKNFVDVQPMVHLDIKMMEVSKEARKQYGFDWAKMASFQVMDEGFSKEWNVTLWEGTDLTGVFTLLSNFYIIYHMLMEDGSGRLLANPRLVCKSGESANFLIGGEIPIPTQGGLGDTNVEWKSYGIKLDFSPQADPSGNVQMKVMAEISSLDYTRGISVAQISMPAVSKRQNETVVNMREGETLVLAELLSNEQTKLVNKVPFFGQIPVFGELFKSREFQDKNTDFLIFITPTIIQPGTIEQKQIRDMERKYKRAGRQLKPSLID